MSLATRRRSILGMTPQQVYHYTRAGAVAARRAYNMYKTAKANTTSTAAAAESAPLTGQFDYKTDYRKRRYGRKMRRKMRFRRRRRARLLRTVKHAAVAPVHLVRRSLTSLTSAVGSSNAVCYGLYGINGTSNDTFNSTDDVSSIFREMDPGSWSNATNPLLVASNHRLWFQHGTLEITIRNTGPNDALIEGYFIRGRQQVNAAWASPTDVYAGGFNKQGTATDPNTGNTFDGPLAATQIGVTPFQCAMFCRSYNIYKRQKFRVPPGNEINIVVSDRRPRTFGLIECNRFATDRRYHGILFQWQGSPDGGGVETPALTTTLTFMAVRRYRFKMVRDSLTTDATDTAA